MSICSQNFAYLVARGYLGLFSFFFERDRSTLLACLLASIEPRTSPSKFGGKFNSLFIRLLTREAEERSVVCTEFEELPSGCHRTAEDYVFLELRFHAKDKGRPRRFCNTFINAPRYEIKENIIHHHRMSPIMICSSSPNRGTDISL